MPRATRGAARTGQHGGVPFLSALVAAILLAAALAPTATAHANLVATTPRDGATVSTAPAEVRVRFDDPVRVGPGNAVVANGGGSVTAGPPRLEAGGHELVLPLDRLLDGDYSVRWRIVSDDGHLEAGVLAFRVGASGAGGGGPPTSVLEAGSTRPASRRSLRAVGLHRRHPARRRRGPLLAARLEGRPRSRSSDDDGRAHRRRPRRCLASPLDARRRHPLRHRDGGRHPARCRGGAHGGVLADLPSPVPTCPGGVARPARRSLARRPRARRRAVRVAVVRRRPRARGRGRILDRWPAPARAVVMAARRERRRGPLLAVRASRGGGGRSDGKRAGAGRARRGLPALVDRLRHAR